MRGGGSSLTLPFTLREALLVSGSDIKPKLIHATTILTLDIHQQLAMSGKLG